MTTRMFVGLEPPSPCRQLLANLDPAIRGLRWLSADQIHLTLAFLGDVEDTSRERLSSALATVKVPPFQLHVETLGAFGRNRPSVVWADIGSAHPHLYALHKRVHDAALGAGLRADLKPFRPHITLGRAKDVSAEALHLLMRAHTGVRFCSFEVTSFALFSSRLMRERSVYHVEERWPLDS